MKKQDVVYWGALCIYTGGMINALFSQTYSSVVILVLASLLFQGTLLLSAREVIKTNEKKTRQFIDDLMEIKRGVNENET